MPPQRLEIAPEQIEAEGVLQKIRAVSPPLIKLFNCHGRPTSNDYVYLQDLQTLHRLQPHLLPKDKYALILTTLPTPREILTPVSATASGVISVFSYARWLVLTTISKTYWLIVHALATLGSIVLFILFIIYLLTRLDWQTTYTGSGQGWQKHSDGYYYWGRPEGAYPAETVTASVVRPEIDGIHSEL